ncbi:hypothetical protein KFL_006370010 [Klebsormidium nitens]|uniref:Uncharacterized protein n=1 Tax=Klebsormidium nitens TaxID=105231 RepID=A0A1Y1INQ4_KLENI|nr:hypothetical protein KFL_006370010 [Klebsormidium nitens]|eukprot:GAQ90416.1 hypothetical protein KFL_006370010 [Klebsormidium nitens]
MKDQHSSLLRQRVTSGKPVAAPMAQAAVKEAASDTKSPVRSEGYLNAKGHNGQINRVYYSVPKGQAATQNALYFVGDYVDGDGDALIERLNTGEGVAATLLPKLDPGSNLFIVYPSMYQDRIWACYTSMLPATSRTGEPLGFDGKDPMAARQLGALLQDALRQISAFPEGTQGGNEEASANNEAGRSAAGLPVGHTETSVPGVSAPSASALPTFVMGFSKGGVVLNEILAEIAALEDRRPASGASGRESNTVGKVRSYTSSSGGAKSSGEGFSGAEAFLESITEVHYVDVGLICPGAYLTDPQKLSNVVRRGARNPLTIGLHGTPRQWEERRRPWIGEEKDRMLATLRAEAAAAGANSGFEVFERGYCEGGKVGMRMHFEIVDLADFGRPGPA